MPTPIGLEESALFWRRRAATPAAWRWIHWIAFFVSLWRAGLVRNSNLYSDSKRSIGSRTMQNVRELGYSRSARDDVPRGGVCHESHRSRLQTMPVSFFPHRFFAQPVPASVSIVDPAVLGMCRNARLPFADSAAGGVRGRAAARERQGECEEDPTHAPLETPRGLRSAERERRKRASMAQPYDLPSRAMAGPVRKIDQDFATAWQPARAIGMSFVR